jgi:hypothetical protein
LTQTTEAEAAGEQSLAPRRPPLLVTAELPHDVQGWADGLRREHFPPERNRLAAHVTLFHALPPGVEDELRQILSDLASEASPAARISGLMKLGNGTALAIECPEMVALHGIVADRMHGLMTRQDSQPLKLHITIQNKVSAEASRALQAELGPKLEARHFHFRAFGLFAYEEGLWRPIREFAFRG